MSMDEASEEEEEEVPQLVPKLDIAATNKAIR